MREAPQLELEPDEFRHVPNKPLATPKDLWRGLVIFLFGAAVCAVTAWKLAALWAAFLPIPLAVWAGIALAGLFPRYFFGKADT